MHLMQTRRTWILATVFLALLAIQFTPLGLFLNLPGLLIVAGGTLAATFLSRPAEDVRAVLASLPALLQNGHARGDATETGRDIAQLLHFARRYRLVSIRAAERELGHIANPFLRAGLQQVVDRASEEELEKSLRWRLSAEARREQGRIQIVNTMAIFAPAFGMLGTLFGLVFMLSGLGSEGLNEIGTSMAFAMITTVYGIVAANLVFKPLAIKLERRSQQRLLHLRALAEGMMLVWHKRHPTLVRELIESVHQGAPMSAPAPATGTARDPAAAGSTLKLVGA